MSVVDQALAGLLGPLEHLGIKRVTATVTVVGQGSKLAVIPRRPRVARAVDLAAGERISGPLLLGRSGQRLNARPPRIVVRLAKRPV